MPSPLRPIPHCGAARQWRDCGRGHRCPPAIPPTTCPATGPALVQKQAGQEGCGNERGEGQKPRRGLDTHTLGVVHTESVCVQSRARHVRVFTSSHVFYYARGPHPTAPLTGTGTLPHTPVDSWPSSRRAGQAGTGGAFSARSGQERARGKVPDVSGTGSSPSHRPSVLQPRVMFVEHPTTLRHSGSPAAGAFSHSGSPAAGGMRRRAARSSIPRGGRSRATVRQPHSGVGRRGEGLSSLLPAGGIRHVDTHGGSSPRVRPSQGVACMSRSDAGRSCRAPRALRWGADPCWSLSGGGDGEGGSVDPALPCASPPQPASHSGCHRGT
jgi:hypothetical protein